MSEMDWKIIPIATVVLVVGIALLNNNLVSNPDASLNLVGAAGGVNFYRCVVGAQFPALTPEIEWFTPPFTSCAVTIHNGGQSSKRVMNVDLDLPPELVTGERFSYDYDDTGWRCPIEGTSWAPVYYTKNWKFTAEPDGQLKGKCTCTVDFDNPLVCVES